MSVLRRYWRDWIAGWRIVFGWWHYDRCLHRLEACSEIVAEQTEALRKQARANDDLKATNRQLCEQVAELRAQLAAAGALDVRGER